MKTDSPTVPMTLKPRDIPIRQWVECASCLESSKDESSVQEWAGEHQRVNPHHDNFRTVSQAYWRLVPTQRTP